MASKFIFLVTFLIFSIPACVIDIKHKRIPHWTVRSGVVLLAAIRFFSFGDPLVRIVLEIISGPLIFAGIRVFTKGKLGMGDVKFAALMGIFLSFPMWFAAAGLASVLGTIFAFSGVISGKLNRNSKIPFAPFLTAGSVGAYFLNYSVLENFQVWM